jgi:hypothetical protein
MVSRTVTSRTALKIQQNNNKFAIRKAADVENDIHNDSALLGDHDNATICVIRACECNVHKKLMQVNAIMA